MVKIKQLVKYLKKQKRVFIQTHNYPDHDAVAASFGLQQLLKHYRIDSDIIYHGEILRDSLQRMIDNLGIEMKHHSSFQIDVEDASIIIDGTKGSRNVAELKSKVVAVIDHHQGEIPEDVKFCDVRSDYGACATIIFSYYADIKLEPSKDVATALYAGISFDTHQLSRNVNIMDIETFTMLHRVSDTAFVNSLIKSSIKLEDLPQHEHLLKNLKVHHNFAYCHFNNGCNKNLLAILSDFVMTLDEIDFVVLSSKYLDEIIFSVRSKSSELPAHFMIQEALGGIGSGGGHIDMAGGRIFNRSDFNEDEIFNKFLTQVRLKNSFKIKISDSLQ
jgi:nanoRNase/pAp phosphatase (c-di-AMP/oligoRNAs hydrolase)